MNKFHVTAVFFCAILFHNLSAQEPKGKLFIIGGGDRPPELMRSMIATAGLRPQDYIVVLPMSSAYPDTAYHYFKMDIEPVCRNAVVNFHFTKETVNKKTWLDSLEKARLIFITGGDQDRFMNAVLHTPVFDAIHKAYRNGATIGGTSAGAAVMSQHMITGHELLDTVYHSTFRRLKHHNIEIKAGLGLIRDAVVDQHFIARSRYNRLLSAVAKYPALVCIGIDEATAVIVEQKKARVSGVGQVVVMRDPQRLSVTASGLIKVEDLHFSVYTDGDEFLLPGPPVK